MAVAEAYAMVNQLEGVVSLAVAFELMEANLRQSRAGSSKWPSRLADHATVKLRRLARGAGFILPEHVVLC